MSNSTPTFIHEFLLKTNKYQIKKLNIKFKVLKELYNTLLAEVFKRHKKSLNDPRRKEAIEFYNNKKTKIHANKLFNQIKKDHGLSKYDLQKVATYKKNNSYMKDHLDSDTIQVLSDRVYDTYQRWVIGEGGKPRFKSWKNAIKSISGKKNACVSFTKNGKVKWTNLLIDVVYDHKDKYQIQQHALNSKIKYCRIKQRTIKGKVKYYLQLCVEGIPKVKNNHIIGNDIVGLDIGVSTIAAVGSKNAFLAPFVSELNNIQSDIKKIQRKIARSQRANNKNNFEPNFYSKGKKKLGKIKKGRKEWNNSNNYIQLKNMLKELYRKQADKRQYLHNIMANEVLTIGKNIMVENNPYKAWQKGWFGKTIGFRAPSLFINTLQRKAESAGGSVKLIDTWSSKLSQYCHVCNGYHKKSLSQRTHSCKEITVQRDLYSALLAKYYNLEAGNVNVTQIRKNWESLDVVLNRATLTCNNKFRILGNLPSSLGFQELEKRNLHEKAVVVNEGSLNSLI